MVGFFSTLNYAQETDTTPILGIGIIKDEISQMNRSFALYEAMEDLKITKTKTPIAGMIDFQMNNKYSIIGKTIGNQFMGTIYKDGKTDNQIIASLNWKEIANQIKEYLSKENIQIDGKVQNVKEGSSLDFPANEIVSLFPKTLPIKIANLDVFQSSMNYFNLKEVKDKNSIETSKELFGNYIETDKKDIFFFKNKEVPDNLKMAIEPIVLPLYETVIVPIKYIDYGASFEKINNLYAASQSYTSSLYSSAKLNASAFEKSILRKTAFEKLANLQDKISDKRQEMKQIYLLGTMINDAFINSEKGKEIYNEYYTNLGEVAKLCATAEQKAKEIRSQKRVGGFMAILNTAQSALTADLSNLETVNSLTTQATDNFKQAFANAQQLSVALHDKYEGIETQIKAENFISDGIEIDTGNSLLITDLFFMISTIPNEVETILSDYAKGKPKLQALLFKYFHTKSKNKEELLNKIVSHIAKIEAIATNFEVRKIPISEKAKVEF